MKVLVTGVAGFIGAALSRALLSWGEQVTGIDNLNDYYDIRLKDARLSTLKGDERFEFLKLDIAHRQDIERLFCSRSFDVVVHLAAQAGVRYSIENPNVYVDTNLVGFSNILEGCRQSKIPHLVYASSSSVYGSNAKLPFSEDDNVDHPISLYAATKKANELMAHAYSHLYRLRTTGLRFFTVYGPWGRPDMALFKFTRNILAGEPIPVYNEGRMVRDFTYIDDIVDGITRIIRVPPHNKTKMSRKTKIETVPYRIYNLGNSKRVDLMDYISALEVSLGRKAKLDLLPMQDGDVPVTEADISRLGADFGYRPQVEFKEGITRFVEWYREYYGVAGAE